MTKHQQPPNLERHDTRITVWDSRSAIRERLALLAEFGPLHDYGRWRYDPHADVWRLGFTMLSRRVKQEGSASLALILKRWQMDRAAAMTMIGYPEK